MENYQQEFPSNGLETKTNLSFISFLLSWFPPGPQGCPEVIGYQRMGIQWLLLSGSVFDAQFLGLSF